MKPNQFTGDYNDSNYLPKLFVCLFFNMDYIYIHYILNWLPDYVKLLLLGIAGMILIGVFFQEQCLCLLNALKIPFLAGKLPSCSRNVQREIVQRINISAFYPFWKVKANSKVKMIVL